MNPLLFLFMGFFCLFILHPLLQIGMFLDGVTYAAIAKNLSLHLGNSWDLHYSQTVFPHFHEHPPLVFWLQSKLFMLLGPEAAAENVYGLILVLTQLMLMSYFWVKSLKHPPETLAILGVFWLAIPLNHLYTENLLEGTLTLLTTLAGFLLLQKYHVVRYAIFGAAAMVMGVMCNGPTALFPLAIPLFGQGTLVKKSAQCGFLTAVVLMIFGLLFVLEPHILNSLQQYLLLQLLPSIAGQRSVDIGIAHHLLIFKLYARGCWIGCIMACLVFVIAARLENKPMSTLWQAAFKKPEVWIFLGISLISALPVGLSPRLNFNYIMQSGPWMTLCLACLCLEPMRMMLQYGRRHCNSLYPISVAFALTALIYCVLTAGGYRRDSDMIEDIHVLKNRLPPHHIIATTPELFYQWYAVAYFARYTSLSLTPDQELRYFLTLKGKALPVNYHAIHLPLRYFVLAQKNRKSSLI